MAVTANQFVLFKQSCWSKEVHLVSDDIRVMLTNGYTPNQDTHRYKSSVTNEVTGTGYTAGGLSLTSRVINVNTSTNTVSFDANDATWPTSTIAATGAVLVDYSPGSDATRPLICYIDFGGTQTSSGGNFTLVWDALGIIADVVA